MINKAILVGRLGTKPERKTLPSGTVMCSFTVATSFKTKNENKKLKEYTTWHNIRVWGSMADNCYQYLDKGKMVYIEGRVDNFKWQDKNGVEKYGTCIQAKEVKFLSPRTKESAPTQSSGHGHDYAPPEARNTGGQAQEFNEEDVPF